MRIRSLLTIAAMLASTQAHAQGDGGGTGGAKSFVAVHGQRSAVMGYPDGGLEVWAYPLQLLSGWRVAFREPGQVRPLDGLSLLTRIERRGAEMVRVYTGPDFVVRERIFAPLDQPGAVIAYEVEGRPDVEIEARFQPSLDLMWPGALGGQSVGWDAARSAYVEREPLHGFTAAIRSPDVAEHDSPMNRTLALNDGLAMVLKPHGPAGGTRAAKVYIGRDGAAEDLERREPELRRAAAVHEQALRDAAVQIITPDPAVNRALEGAVDALDQAWVCDPGLGCGEVAGYGPSRAGRRPQYDWFFAGDGLIAVEALVAAGEHERAREELAFVAAHQNKANGMIWHEISQSAPYVDWERAYPYMFVHVDITYQYLATVGDYVSETGDAAFVREHWAGLEAAWRYCRSLIDAQTRLPRIPRGKEGANEQDEMRDDISLSSAWIDAARGFTKLARAAGRGREAAEAEAAADAARKAVAAQDWDAEHGFWLSGHTGAGRPIYEQRSKAAHVLLQDVFKPAQTEAVLDRLAAPDFQTDWGERGLSSAAPEYEPNLYSRGSVSALGTSAVATDVWASHRPLTGWSLWRSLAAWSSLDSPGRMHEVLAGDLFHPEIESVPEQTWSSAGFVSGAVRGLLGIEIDAAARRLTLAPHLPAQWDTVEVRRLRVGAARLDVRIRRDADGISLEIDNAGEPVSVAFDPEIPLGAELKGAEVGGAEAKVQREVHAQDAHARLELTAAHGLSRARIRYAGGVLVLTPETAPRIGDESRGLKIEGATWADGVLSLRGWVRDAEHASLDFRTPLKPAGAEGARLTPLGGDAWRLQFPVVAGQGDYAPVAAVVRFGQPAT